MLYIIVTIVYRSRCGLTGSHFADHRRAAERAAGVGTAADVDTAGGGSRIILHQADGLSQQETARRVGVNRPVVSLWENRFLQAGLAGLADAKGRGHKPSIASATQGEIISRATRPPPGRRRWSVRTMAQAMGVSKATVQRLWSANEIKPHLVRTFKLSNDPAFEAKFWDVIGLYLDAPDKALVLCCDEKSQCQALERTQPGLPLGVGHIRTKTHDYTRHGTITLFAALSYLDGKIFGQTAPRHTHHQWLAFLKHLDAKTPADLTLHLVIDNYATHKPRSKVGSPTATAASARPMAASASSFISPRPPARG
jgi:transcriptional regulator with XRE-family HTH domain